MAGSVTPPAGTPDPRLREVAQAVAEILEDNRSHVLAPGGPDRLPIRAGAAAVLNAVGLLELQSDGTLVPRSRHARLALASIGRMLEQGHSILSGVQEAAATEYLISLTHALEQGRIAQAGALDRVQPIHQRRIINVLIKGRQIRGGRMVNVYLHALHPEWGEYHLIGASQSRDVVSDEHLAHSALGELGLARTRYRLDATYNPPEITNIAISATSGAVTEYTYRVFRLANLDGKLSLPRDQRDRFRWFTWDEIQRGQGSKGEPIMGVTSTILANVGADTMSVNAKEAEDSREKTSIRDELLNRITYRRLALILVLLFVSVVCWLIVGVRADTLDRLGKLGSAFGAVFGLAAVIIAILSLRE